LRLDSYHSNNTCLQETRTIHKKLEETLDLRVQQTLTLRLPSRMALKVNNLNRHIAQLAAKASMCKA
jgi:hypothetical protein